MAKKLLISGFIAILLIGSLASILFFSQSGQEQRKIAQAATVLSFSPPTSQTNPLQKAVGDTINLDLQLDPATNEINAIQLLIIYDPTKLATASAGFSKNATFFPEGEGPFYETGKIIVTLGTGPNPLNVIKVKSTIASISFKALAQTTTPTSITISKDPKDTFITSSNRKNDAADENVLSDTQALFLSITGSSQTTPGAQGKLPICTSLVADRSFSGTAPYSLTFTVNGTDEDGTITKATFNFGDGPVQNLTTSGGIGTNAVSAQLSHTYNNPTTYTASVILTDDKNNVSTAAASCTQTITVSTRTATGPGGPGTSTPTPTATASATITATPSATLAPTATLTPTPTKTPTPTASDETKGGKPTPTIDDSGPGDIFIGAGAIGLILTVIGGILLLTL